MDLKQQALDIYHESEKIGDRVQSCQYRLHCLEEIPEADRWKVKEYIRRIGRERTRKAAVHYCIHKDYVFSRD